MVNAHLPLKCPYSLAHYGIFKMLRHVTCKCHVVTLSKTSYVLKFQIHISKRIIAKDVLRMACYIVTMQKYKHAINYLYNPLLLT